MNPIRRRALAPPDVRGAAASALVGYAPERPFAAAYRPGAAALESRAALVRTSAQLRLRHEGTRP